MLAKVLTIHSFSPAILNCNAFFSVKVDVINNIAVYMQYLFYAVTTSIPREMKYHVNVSLTNLIKCYISLCVCLLLII